MVQKPRVIVDCDPGDDDAIALLLAGRHTDLLGVTTVSGNVPLALTTRNALIVMELLRLDVPVHAGADRPLVAHPSHGDDVHGATGLDGPDLWDPTRAVADRNAVGFIIDAVAREDALTLIATGPLTNIALAIRLAPETMGRLKEISIMGGSASWGNRTAVAEFNILHDPEAAAIVFSSGIPIKMAGINLTHQIKANADDRRNIRAIGTTVSDFVADILDHSAATYADIYFGKTERPLHDPCAVLAVTHPHLFRYESRHVVVETRGEHTRGMTVVDERAVKQCLPPNAEVGYHVDSDGMRSVLLDTIASYTP